MQNRTEAKAKYDWGNKFLAKKAADAKEGIQNVVSAISYYTKSLFLLRSISREEATREDDKSIQDALEALLQAINKLLCLSSDWSQVVDELEKFLKFYVDSVKILNKTHQRLPGLDALELKIDGPFTVLTAKAPSVPQKERLKNYVAVISLFHVKLETEKNHKLSSNDPIVIESFALYNRALKALEATVKVEDPVEEEQPPSKVLPTPSKEVPLPPELPQPSAAQVQKQRPKAIPPSPRFNSVQQFKGSQFRLFDYAMPDDPKRVAIRELMDRKEFVQAFAGHRRIMTHNADDYRRACDCQLVIGEDHGRNSRFIEAITCYKEALTCCKYIQKDDVLEVDIMNIAKVFKALINTMNETTKLCLVKFSDVSQCMEEFLHLYLDNFEALNSSNKKLPGLDEINLDCLIKFLHGTRDGVFRDKTMVYIAVIGMFQKEAKLEKGELESMLAEIEIQKGAWNDVTMLNIVDLYEKALALVKKIQGHEVLNRELNAVPEPEEKRHKGGVELSSSSSFPPFVYH